MSSDVIATASGYASVAGFLAGVSFAALAIYLRREGELPAKGIGAKQVTVTLFYAMASLVMSSFLYASITTQADDVERASAGLLLYGVVFGSSVLTLFYALTLMIYENPHTHFAAKYAYWVVVVAGPAVVLRFLVDAAQSTWRLRYPAMGLREDWSVPLVVGVVFLAILISLSVLITVFGLLQRWSRTRSLRHWLAVRPAFPAVVVFVAAACVTVGSMFMTVPLQFAPTNWFILLSLIAGFALLALFALACGCVVGSRVGIGRHASGADGVARTEQIPHQPRHTEMST
jgi:hypothetical protein